MANKLVIIDGNSLFYRSFYALPLLSNSDGEYSNAVYGFAIQIVKIIQDIKPTHIAVAFDAGKHTFRNDMYSEYKSTRKPMPTELKCQIEPLKKMLKLMNIDYCEKLGVEGDDIVGTLAKRFADTQTIIVTADRDTLQLIDDTTNVYFTKKGTSELYIVDEEVLKKDYKVSPKQIIDLKALQGDKSDNIPGVAGVGEKTAQTLIEKYGSLDGIYEHIEEVSGKLKDNLLSHKEDAYLSYKLATIKTDVDLDCSLDDCEYIYPFKKEVQEFFKHYEFKTLLKKQECFEQSDAKQETHVIEKIALNSEETLKMMQNFTKNATEIAVFVNNGDIFIGNNNCEFAILKDSEYNIATNQQIQRTFAEIISGSVSKIFFDSKFMKHFLDGFGVSINANFFDLSIAKHLVDGVSVKSADDVLIDEDDWQNPASVIFGLKTEYEKKLKDLGLYNLYQNVELPLVDVLFDMEKTGIKVDIEVLEQLSVEYKQELSSLEQQIYMFAGEEFNINSPKQLGVILYDKLGLGGGRKKSTSADKLEALANKHPIVELVLRYRKIAKLNNTYIDGFKPHLDKESKVHTTFKQTLTNTGRLSSVDPNLQNIPIRSDEGRVVRSMFVASTKNHVLVDADYSQIELRLLAHLSGDEYFIDAFNNNEDIHTSTASQVFGVEPEMVTREMRRIAKVVNFGIIYGISGFGLSNDLGINPKQATDLIETFYQSHQRVKQFMESAVNIARETGRVSTLLGRSRKMTDITSNNYVLRSMAERASQNMPLQGSAADIVKIAMINVHNQLKQHNLKAKLILQVHDELIIDCPVDEESEVKQIVKDAMENAYKLKVPLTVDIQSSYRWSDGH